MRIRSTRLPEVTAPTGPPPRDSEALEHVLEALDAGVTGDADAHRRVVRALGEALELPHAAVWLPEPSGGFRLDSEFGRLAGKLPRDPRSGATLAATPPRPSAPRRGRGCRCSPATGWSRCRSSTPTSRCRSSARGARSGRR